MILKNVGKTFRAAVAILAISLFTLVSDATAQVFCSNSWTTACASVTVEVRPGSEFSQTTAPFVLIVSVVNASFNVASDDPFMEVESSVIRQLLFRVTDGNGITRFPTVDFWVTDGNVAWVDWELTRDGDFTKIGSMWTQNATNDDGACVGIVTDPTLQTLPCLGNTEKDHRTSAVFYLGFEEIPLELEGFAAQFVNMDASTCYPPELVPEDPYCESDWAQTVVPEPATVVLLGTGLTAVVGLMRRRRRRGLDIVTD